MASQAKPNPFEADDELNPFGQVEHYNPFAPDARNNFSDNNQVPLNEPSAELKFRSDENYSDNSNSFYSDSTPNDVIIEEDNNDKAHLVSGGSSFDPFNSAPPPPIPQKTSQTKTIGNSRVTVQTSEPEDDDTLHFWQLEFYQQYYNVDSKEVLMRCLRSMWPFKYDFVATVKQNPDFYGPFWISTTLIFMMAASANFSAYLNNSETWRYDLNKLIYGSAVIYGYVFLLPLIFWMYIKWADLSLKLIEVLCIYGYSLFIYSPVAILCLIPIPWAQWVVVGIGCGLSTAFLIVNLWMPLRERLTYGIIVLIVMALFHVGLALTFRLYFFLYT